MSLAIAYCLHRMAQCRNHQGDDHHLLKVDFAPTHTALMRLVETGDVEVVRPWVCSAHSPRPHAIPNLLWERLDQLLNDD